MEARVLNKYLAQVQRFCRDQKQEFLDIGNLVDYINRARREVAGRTQCIRRLTTISGSIKSWTVTNGGSGYSNSKLEGYKWWRRIFQRADLGNYAS